MTLSIHNPRVIAHARSLGITDLEARDRLLAIDMAEAKYQAVCDTCNAGMRILSGSVSEDRYAHLRGAVQLYGKSRRPSLLQRIRNYFNLDGKISPDWNKYS